MGGWLGPLNTLAQGPFTINSTNTLAKIANQDGTSNTFLFGETIGDQEVQPRQLANSWIGGIGMVTAWGTALTPNSGWFQFSSQHTGGANFLLCDGSVHRPQPQHVRIGRRRRRLGFGRDRHDRQAHDRVGLMRAVGRVGPCGPRYLSAPS